MGSIIIKELSSLPIQHEVILRRFSSANNFQSQYASPRNQVQKISWLITIYQRINQSLLCCDMVQDRTTYRVCFLGNHIYINALIKSNKRCIRAYLGISSTLYHGSNISLHHHLIIRSDNNRIFWSLLNFFYRLAEKETFLIKTNLFQHCEALICVP